MMGTIIAHGGHNSRLLPYHTVLYTKVGAPDKPSGVGRADANPKLLLNDT